MNTVFPHSHQKRATLKIASAAFALGASLLISGGAAAQVYKCKAGNGHVTYSDEPCPANAQQTKVELQENVIETHEDAERVRRNLTGLEGKGAQHGQQLGDGNEPQNAAPPQDATDKKTEPDHSIMGQMMRRREAGQRKIERKRETRLGNK